MMKAHITRLALTLAAAALLILVAAAPATAETQTFRDQESFSFFIPCANGGLGENVDGILKVRATFGTTTDAADGFHLHLNFKAQGVGIGDVTGDTYQVHADVPEFLFIPTRENQNPDGSFNGAINFSVDVIGTGDAPNFHATFRDQVTYNANGVLTMEKVVMTETCN